MVKCNVGIDVPQPNWPKAYYVSSFRGVGQYGLIIFMVTCNDGAVVSQPNWLTDCLFGEAGFIFCVLIKVLWLTSPTGISKRLVHAEIALSFVALLGFVT